MINVVISPQCKEIIDLLEIDRDMVATTVNERHRGLIDPGLTRIAAVHWFSNKRIVFADTVITKRDIEKTTNRVFFHEVKANIVLELSPEIPSGRIDRSMRMEEILYPVAASFGQPVTCHSQEEPATLYSGPWDGKTIKVKGNRGTSICVCGSFSTDNDSANLVWAFDLERYRDWFVG